MAQQLKCWLLNATNHQQNPCMTTGIKFVIIPFCTINYLLYQEFLSVCAYPQSIAGFLYYQLFVDLTAITVTIFLLLSYS